MGNYETLAQFFQGDYLELRHEKVLNFIKNNTTQTSVMLMAYLDKKENEVKPIERQRVLALIADLSEVVFAAENLHIYITGMSRISTDEESRNRKIVEIKNQGYWITRHLPALWDAALIYARFDSTFGKYLITQEELNFHYFEAINGLVLNLSVPRYSYLRLFDVDSVDKFTKVILASSLAASVIHNPKTHITLTEREVRMMANIQAHSYDSIKLSVKALIEQYTQAIGTAPMAETEEVLRLIDELNGKVISLQREYGQVLDDLIEVPDATVQPTRDVFSFETAVTKMQEMLRKRLNK